MWYYKSPIGLMKIFLNREGRYSLQISETVYGLYDSPVAAADDVYTFSTGCGEWDLLVGTVEPPTDVYEWDRP